mgnify:CR=1 FL=1
MSIPLPDNRVYLCQRTVYMYTFVREPCISLSENRVYLCQRTVCIFVREPCISLPENRVYLSQRTVYIFAREPCIFLSENVYILIVYTAVLKQPSLVLAKFPLLHTFRKLKVSLIKLNSREVCRHL